MFGAILKATNISFQKGMTFCRSIYVKKVKKLLAFMFEQPSYCAPLVILNMTILLTIVYTSAVTMYLTIYRAKLWQDIGNTSTTALNFCIAEPCFLCQMFLLDMTNAQLNNLLSDELDNFKRACVLNLHKMWQKYKSAKIVSEYDQEIPQSQIAGNPMAP